MSCTGCRALQVPVLWSADDRWRQAPAHYITPYRPAAHRQQSRAYWIVLESLVVFLIKNPRKKWLPSWRWWALPPTRTARRSSPSKQVSRLCERTSCGEICWAAGWSWWFYEWNPRQYYLDSNIFRGFYILSVLFMLVGQLVILWVQKFVRYCNFTI